MTLLSSSVRTFTSFVAIVMSAGAAAFAVDNHRAPAPADLRRLGIDPQSFLTLGHG